MIKLILDHFILFVYLLLRHPLSFNLIIIAIKELEEHPYNTIRSNITRSMIYRDSVSLLIFDSVKVFVKITRSKLKIKISFSGPFHRQNTYHRKVCYYILNNPYFIPIVLSYIKDNCNNVKFNELITGKFDINVYKPCLDMKGFGFLGIFGVFSYVEPSVVYYLLKYVYKLKNAQHIEFKRMDFTHILYKVYKYSDSDVMLTYPYTFPIEQVSWCVKSKKT